jgi:hypothetical protein
LSAAKAAPWDAPDSVESPGGESGGELRLDGAGGESGGELRLDGAGAVSAEGADVVSRPSSSDAWSGFWEKMFFIFTQ